jgi:hypothetical protein
MSNVRSRKLLDLAHRVNECTNCGKWSEHGCEPAHQNGISAGKGFGIKSHDHRHAALCHACHAWYDQGGKRSPCEMWSSGQKEFMWTAAHMKTMDLYFSNGWLKVAA